MLLLGELHRIASVGKGKRMARALKCTQREAVPSSHAGGVEILR